MKKLILAIAVIAISTATVQAQDKMSTKNIVISISANAGIPTTTGYTFAFGGDLQADFAITKNLKITISAGFDRYTFNNYFGGSNYNDYEYWLPLLAGAKFSLGKNAYVHTQVGYGFDFYGLAESGNGAFAYAPGVGYYFSSKLDASIKYLAFTGSGFTTNQIGVRLAYSF